MMFTTLLQSISNIKNRWLTGVAIAGLATLAGSMTVMGGSLNPSSGSPITGGVHLYGESERPDVVGKEYIIFETIGNKTIGAFYLPRSEFNCFYGQFKGSRLDVTLIDAFDRQKYNFSLALSSTGLTASKQPLMGEPTYQPLGKISNNDRQILATCKLQLQTQH
jgi:hypothetical protein